MKDPDGVWEDLVSHKIFDVDKILVEDEDDLKKAFNKKNDTKKRIRGRTFEFLATSDKVNEIAEKNRLPIAQELEENVPEIKTSAEATPLLVKSEKEREDIFDRVQKRSEAKNIFTGARGDLEAKQIGLVRERELAKQEALEQRRERRSEEFLQETTYDELRTNIGSRGKKISTLSNLFDTPEYKVRERVTELGFVIENDEWVRI